MSKDLMLGKASYHILKVLADGKVHTLKEIREAAQPYCKVKVSNVYIHNLLFLIRRKLQDMNNSLNVRAVNRAGNTEFQYQLIEEVPMTLTKAGIRIHEK